MLLRATLDTNLFFDLWHDRPGRTAVERLVALAVAGKIDLAVTRYVHDDVPAPPLADEIHLHELQISNTGGVFQLDISRLDDVTDRLGDQSSRTCGSSTSLPGTSTTRA